MPGHNVIQIIISTTIKTATTATMKTTATAKTKTKT